MPLQKKRPSHFPPPPPFTEATETMNGNTGINGVGPGGRASWAGADGTGSGSNQNGKPGRRFPHIKDLGAQSALTELDIQMPLNTLLHSAVSYMQQSQTHSDFNRPDIAYVEYLRASEVALNWIPRHKDYASYRHDRRNWETQYISLLKAIQSQQEPIDMIKRIIIEDNATSGVQPTVELSAPPRPSSSSNSLSTPMVITPSASPDDSTRSAVNGIRVPSPTSFQTLHPTSSSAVYESPSQSRRLKPAVRPKPDNLHGRVLSESGPAPVDLLAQRFARLRLPQGTSSGATNSSGTGFVPMPSPSDFVLNSQPRNLNSHATVSGSNYVPSSRPSGPRDMPPSQNGPSLPPKIPLTPLVANLPRAPSPTYSPSRSSITSPTISNPPRTSTDSTRSGNVTYIAQMAPPPYSSQPRFTPDDTPYRAKTPNGVHNARITKSSSADLPSEHSVTAQKLYDYLRKYNVLLIDVRSRNQFDQGHIFSKSILCVEPVCLNENVSLDALAERLVVSPDSEQALFEKVNEFDLVVYYDQNTVDTAYLSGPPGQSRTPGLRALFDSLYEWNLYKQLKDGRLPALLAGGLDAWVDLVGPQSLATSKTAALVGSTRPRKPRGPGRPLGRVPMASANSSFEVRKKRMASYKPLNADEEQAWLKKAYDEEVDTSSYTQNMSDSESGELETLEEEPNSPFVHDYEAFLRKFPEPQAMQQSMIMPSQPPPPPTHFENPSMPLAPSRPPPAVPRPSYSGVSDGRQTQAPLARQTSATRPPLYASNSIVQRLKLPRTGLTNFGVTCYMNSTIQCLSATVLLSKFFIDNRYRYYVQKNWKGSQGIMPGLYANLVRSLWKNDVEVIKPTSLRNFCGRMNREWAIDRQQDAKEFFDFLVDCLHEDLNINWERTQLRPLTFEEELQRERLPIHRVSQIEWGRYVHREESYISSLFAGQHASRLRCTTCHNTSTTYEAFYSISVEIPRSGVGDIYQCLRSYCSEEMLSGDEVWKCPYCKCEREATKQIILTRAPQFLVVHFKRFSASKTESARKVHTPIDFPLYGLNMDPFMIPPAPKPVTNGDTTTKIEPAITPPYSYDAYGVLRHLGNSGNSGHYISLVKDSSRGCWRKFDDERVSDFEPHKMRFNDRLQNEQAYIVFFQRAAAR